MAFCPEYEVDLDLYQRFIMSADNLDLMKKDPTAFAGWLAFCCQDNPKMIEVLIPKSDLDPKKVDALKKRDD